MTQEKQAFEQSFRGKGYNLQRATFGYVDPQTSLLFSGYKASRESLRLELLKILHPNGAKHPQQAEIDSLLDKVRQLAKVQKQTQAGGRGMTQEAFERWVETQDFTPQGKTFEKCFHGGWQASRESLKQELLSDEMVEVLGQEILEEINKEATSAEIVVKAALQAISERL